MSYRAFIFLLAILAISVVGIIFPVIAEGVVAMWHGIVMVIVSMADPVQINRRWAFAPPAIVPLGLFLAILYVGARLLFWAVDRLFARWLDGRHRSAPNGTKGV